jgi:DNA (cytosine-5)-methyltransferase 1
MEGVFSGCGGLSLGVHEICRRMNKRHVVEFASEWDAKALEIFTRNFNPVRSSGSDIDSLLSPSHRKKPTKMEREFLDSHPNIMEPDLLVGGPPCQGHSDLNNHTRREDSRNNLYFRMLRAAQILSPKAVIIENVSTVVHSKEKVVQRTRKNLEKLGYKVAERILLGHHFGVPQKRRRHFLVASREGVPDFDQFKAINSGFIEDPRTLRWAIEDLRESYNPEEVFNSSSIPSPRNQERMDFLLDEEIYDLPNEERPLCHRDGHNYPAVYGRMSWDEPSSTITAGFGSTGQGRFMHPERCSIMKKGRTLTPHEAARIQTFPDWFDFRGHLRGTLSKTIGNAVPPLLAMYVAHIALSAGE